MAARTLGDMVSAVARAVGGSVPLGEIQQAIFDANRELHGRSEWPWLYKDALIGINGPYTTGTVSWTSGTTLTGTGTTWLTSWKYKRIFFSSTLADYQIASVQSATSLTLAQAPNLTDAVTDATYTIFQDTYAYPSDYDSGSDVGLYDPNTRIQIKKIPVYTLAQQAVALQQAFTAFQTAYSDYGYDDTASRYLLRLVPPPSGTTEFKFNYRRTPPDLSLIGSTSILPEAFVECLQLFAESRVRRTRKLGGANEAEARGMVAMRAMKRRVQTQPMVNKADDHGTAFGYPESSYTEGNLAVRPWSS